MDFKELAQARYSLRKFSDRPVEQEKLDLILEAARCAPTAHNLQPQRVLVLRSPEAREKAHKATYDSHKLIADFERLNKVEENAKKVKKIEIPVREYLAGLIQLEDYIISVMTDPAHYL